MATSKLIAEYLWGTERHCPAMPGKAAQADTRLNSLQACHSAPLTGQNYRHNGCSLTACRYCNTTHLHVSWQLSKRIHLHAMQ